jgi:hypothetical protein
MAVPQIDAGNCTIVVTLCLWLWTRLKLPDGCHYQESGVTRQNIIASWAFATLIGLQILGFLPHSSWLETVIAGSSGMVLFLFALLAYGSEGGFWSKRRNQGVGLIVILFASFAAELVIAMPNFIPVLSALAISHLCRKRYIQIVVSSVKDLEAIHAKLLKQDATFQNTRNFDNFPIQKTS